MKQICESYNFDKEAIEEIYLIITEILTNVEKYGDNYAKIKISPWIKSGEFIGIEVIVQDYGDGIEDISYWVKDGNSISGSMGVGLGTISRLSDEFAIHSKDEISPKGTRISFKKGKKYNKQYFESQVHNKCQLRIASEIKGKYNRPNSIHHSIWIEDDNTLLLCMIEGRGKDISTIGLDNKVIGNIIRENLNASLDTITTQIGRDIMNSLGVNLILLRFDKIISTIELINIGNLNAYLISNKNGKKLQSMDGIVSDSISDIYIELIKLSNNSTIILTSKGISSDWSMDMNINFEKYHHHQIARDIIEKYGREDEESSIIVIQNM